MAARSTHVVFENRTGMERALEKSGDHLDHGIWTDNHPPQDLVGDGADWSSESQGCLPELKGL
jgi:hypothetical protein